MKTNSQLVRDGWVPMTIPSYGTFDKGLSYLVHTRLSLRLLVTPGRVTMHNKAGDYLGDWSGSLPEMSSSTMPVVKAA